MGLRIFKNIRVGEQSSTKKINRTRGLESYICQWSTCIQTKSEIKFSMTQDDLDDRNLASNYNVISLREEEGWRRLVVVSMT